MNRAEYQAQREGARFQSLCREERNLPHHPDGSGSATCPVCQGAGEIEFNNTNPHGYGPDPQCDDCAPCPNPDCLDGYVKDGEADPILSLRSLRRESIARRPFAHARYSEARARTYRPALCQLRMIEAAIGCTVACDAAVAAWRKAA